MHKTFDDLTDKILVDKFREGDAKAYDVLFKRYYTTFYKYALKNVRDTFIAEELAMDVMLGLWKNKGNVYIDQDLQGYLYRATKNALYNHYRKKILATVSMDAVNEETTASDVKSGYDSLQSSDLEKIYQQKLKELSPQRRKVYQMSREENKTYSEIAADLNLSVNTVENYMVASLSFFRKHLQEHVDLTLVLMISLFRL